jgi:signal transduction histidine kinase
VVSAVYGLVASDKEFALSAAKSIRFLEENDYGIDSKSTESRNLSEYLHNTLQSELLRLSKQLEIAEDPEKISMYYKQLEVALSRTREDIHALKSQGLDRLVSVCQSWEGIAKVVLEFEDVSDIESEKISYVCDILEEIINNSIRYGNADQISIYLRGRAPQIDISVSHNGGGEISDGMGLGSLTILSKAIIGPVIEKSIDSVTFRVTV